MGAGSLRLLYCSERIYKKLVMRTEWLRDRFEVKTFYFYYVLLLNIELYEVMCDYIELCVCSTYVFKILLTHNFNKRLLLP